jgi:hypothetical protein
MIYRLLVLAGWIEALILLVVAIAMIAMIWYDFVVEAIKACKPAALKAWRRSKRIWNARYGANK